jgi:YidC/Oxa1 family membrane protein insertase
MEKRYVLALVLMVAVMFGWSWFYGRKLPKPEQTTEQATEQSREASPLSPDSSFSSEATVDTTQSAQVEAPSRSRQPVRENQTVHVETGKYHIIFSVGRFAYAHEWAFKEYPDRSVVGESLFNLIPETAQNCLSVHFLNQDLTADAMDTFWETDKTEFILTDQNPQDTLTFSKRIGENLRVLKKFTFYHDRYYVDLELAFQNLSNQPLISLDAMSDTRSGYKLRWGPGMNADLLVHERKGGKRTRHNPKSEGARALSSGASKPVKEFDDSQSTDTVLWAGMNNKYFAVLMIPDGVLSATYELETLSDNGTTAPTVVTAASEAASLIVPGFSLDSNSSRSDQFRIYVGPKEYKVLKTIEPPGAQEEDLQLADIIDLGFFWYIAWVMLWLLNFFYSIIKNYGVAIILLTLLVKVVSYPLTRKGYKSMQAMQKLQPLLTEIREKHRDDPQKLNKVTMQLYKEHGVNPFGGCIPWIPQIPVFIALFALLGSAVELRGAPFFLWIDDLAAPDVLFTLPFTIPFLGDAVRLLPLVNGVTTWLQQKTSGSMTPVTDNTQAKIMQFMPLLFVFILYNFASGLALYWLCNNIFTIGQQYLPKLWQSDDTEEATPVSAPSIKKQLQSGKRRSPNANRRK